MFKVGAIVYVAHKSEIVINDKGMPSITLDDRSGMKLEFSVMPPIGKEPIVDDPEPHIWDTMDINGKMCIRLRELGRQEVDVWDGNCYKNHWANEKISTIWSINLLHETLYKHTIRPEHNPKWAEGKRMAVGEFYIRKVRTAASIIVRKLSHGYMWRHAALCFSPVQEYLKWSKIPYSRTNFRIWVTNQDPNSPVIRQLAEKFTSNEILQIINTRNALATQRFLADDYKTDILGKRPKRWKGPWRTMKIRDMIGIFNAKKRCGNRVTSFFHDFKSLSDAITNYDHFRTEGEAWNDLEGVPALREQFRTHIRRQEYGYALGCVRQLDNIIDREQEKKYIGESIDGVKLINYLREKLPDCWVGLLKPQSALRLGEKMQLCVNQYVNDIKIRRLTVVFVVRKGTKNDTGVVAGIMNKRLFQSYTYRNNTNDLCGEVSNSMHNFLTQHYM